MPRIARPGLSAGAGSAATAVDSTEFVVRFWHMIFSPQDTLKDTLPKKNQSLESRRRRMKGSVVGEEWCQNAAPLR